MQRFFLFALVSIAVLACVVSILIMSIFFVPNNFKPLFEQWARIGSQRTLTIGGDVRVDFNNSQVIIQVNDVTLSEFQQDTPFVTIEEAQLSLAPGQLWNQRIIVDNVAIKGLRAQLIRDRNGRLNIEDLLRQSENPLPFVLEIVRTEMTGSDFVLRDEVTHHQIEFNHMNLTTSQVTAAFVETLALTVPLIEVGQVVFKNNGASMENKLDRALAMQLDVKQLEFNEAGVGNGSAVFFLRDIATDSYMNVQLSILETDQSAQTNGLLGNVRMDAEMAMQYGLQTVHLFLGTVFTVGKSGKQWVFTDIESEFSDFHPELIRNPVHGQFGGNLKLDMSAEHVQTELQGMLAGSRFIVTSSIQDFTNPVATFDIELDALDLDALVAMDKLKSPQNNTDSNDLPDFSFLNDLKLNGEITIGLLTAGGARFSGLRFVMTPDEQSLLNSITFGH
ncbi:AsmA family protein [Nitrosomonas marina]|uniref:AsmA family protein n=1 Tax=Nitrosomonas marina TaxID=917 RepID=A0A1H8CEB1_9PROT|nr:AsmA family protein [Nitrosomonas marina]SEM92628.1 AsmA family protein [Nitrosomonas marina]